MTPSAQLLPGYKHNTLMHLWSLEIAASPLSVLHFHLYIFVCILIREFALQNIATKLLKPERVISLYFPSIAALTSATKISLYCKRRRVFHPFVSLFEEMTTHLILSPNVTCQPPHALSHWQLTACEAKDHGRSVRRSGEVGGRQSLMHDVCLRAPSCACVWYVSVWRKLYLNVCHAEGMDACQRRE